MYDRFKTKGESDSKGNRIMISTQHKNPQILAYGLKMAKVYVCMRDYTGWKEWGRDRGILHLYYPKTVSVAN